MIHLTVDQQRSGLRALNRALKEESDGKQLKRDLAKRLRGVMDPLRAQVIARLMRMPSTGASPESMRQAIARQTRAATRFSGRNTGVALVQRARGMPRGFQYAGRAFNRPEGWNPQTPGGITVHQEMRPVQWFDQPTSGAVDDARRQVSGALEDMAQRLAQRAGGE